MIEFKTEKAPLSLVAEIFMLIRQNIRAQENVSSVNIPIFLAPGTCRILFGPDPHPHHHLQEQP